MSKKSQPDSCPTCQGSRVVCILWDYYWALESRRATDVANNRAILGLSHYWFTSADPTLVAGRFSANKAQLPAWACLDCAPQWNDVHRLASAELEIDTAKEAAVLAYDFEKAAVLHHDGRLLEAAHVAKFERLLRELVGSE